MRVIGLLLITACAFILTRNLDLSAEALWFLSVGAGLGVITFATSWIPMRAPEVTKARVRA